tara:strand:+ start:2147 stop:2740 length:594 start_codon:yes stop_codon:yes gene_type:complete
MNFDADRLSRLSGLSPAESTGVITESANTDSSKSLNEGCGCDASPCGCDKQDQHGMDHREDDMGAGLVLFEMEEDLYEEEEGLEEAAEALDAEATEVEDLNVDDVKEESTALTMETLRDTVLELRNEIIAEQAAEQQALMESPVRAAIRKEIKALLSEMPEDAATNWIYGKKGKPTSTNDRSRATAFAGIGFENSKK